jgi:hypothetical protein
MLSYVVAMPGSSCSGALKPLTADERVLVENLRRHVASVASREHNLSHPSELEAAARHIEVTLSSLGYGTAAQRFVVDGKEVRNIEVEVAGGAGAGERRRGALRFGVGPWGRTTTARGLRRCSSLRGCSGRRSPRAHCAW